MRRPAGESGYDFDPIFASAIPRIQAADLAICHMETPYGPDGGPYTGFPVFAVPASIAKTIHDVGYDTCSTASNHSLDDGAGRHRSVRSTTWTRPGVKHTGTARSAAEAATPDILDVNGVKVAQLSYAYGFNGIPLPRGKPWLANLINVPNILAAAHRAKQAGADVVIVSLHFGTQYQEAPEPAAGGGRDGAAGLAGRGSDPRLPRPHRPAVPEDQRQVGRVRHGQPDREPGLQQRPQWTA